MKIAVNARLLLKDKIEGIGRFSYEVLKRITKNNPDIKFYFIFDRPFSEEFIFSKNIEPVVCFPPSRHPLLWYWWFEFSLPNVLKKIEPDLFFSPDGYLSLSTKVPSFPVIHDINFMHDSYSLPKSSLIYYKHFFPRFARKAKRIITVSEFSKTDIAKSFQIDENKIDVAYNGVSDFFSVCTEKECSDFKTRFTQGKDYFVYAGSINPRKNIASLCLAFEEFKNMTQSPAKLLIVGKKMYGGSDIENVLMKMHYSKDVIFTGRLSDEDLKIALSAALALVYIPFFEGFGLPIVEAMKAGTAVITSHVSALPEIGSDAVMYVDPHSIASISQELVKIFENKEVRNMYIQKGFERAKLFHWDKTAEIVWNTLIKDY